MTAELKPSLRIGSWNIHKAVGTDRRRDAERVLAAIAALRADVVALQEAELTDLGLAALLHDMGQRELPEPLRDIHRLGAPDALRGYQTYVAHSLVFARRMGVSASALLGIAQHQELLDGSGFPLGLGGDGLRLRFV